MIEALQETDDYFSWSDDKKVFQTFLDLKDRESDKFRNNREMFDYALLLNHLPKEFEFTIKNDGINPNYTINGVNDTYEVLHKKGIKFEVSEKFEQLELNDGTIIRNNPRNIKKSYDIQDIIGFDTETYEGKCRLLCRSHGKMKHTSTEPSFLECLNFLFYKANDNHLWYFFYNIDFDYNAIIKTLDIEKQKIIEIDDKSINLCECCKYAFIEKMDKGFSLDYGDYNLCYLKPTMFTIRKQKKKVVITDLFRLFRISLNNASVQFLQNEHKENIDGEKLNTSLEYWNENLDDIISYCIQDCKLVNKLGMIFLEHLQKSGVSIPKYLCSPASLSKVDFRKNCCLPSICEIPKKILQISYDCYYGGRFEILKRGTFEKAYCYDVNSEYPEIIKDLPSLKYGLWLYYTNLKELPKEQCFGYFNVKVIIPDDNYISTIPVKWKGMIRFPNGLFEGWFTWFDLDLMRDYIVEIKEAYIYTESQFEYYPFRERIKFHYEQKAKWKGKNEIMYMIHKLTMNAKYGCTFEIHNVEQIDGTIERITGVLFNPVYASQITAFGRWKILKPVWNVKEKLIGFHTDSILSMVSLDDYLDIGKNIGQWSKEAEGKTYIINTGMYQINDKKKKLIKTRGIPIKYINDWFEFASKNGDNNKCKFFIKRMTKIGQALREYKNLDMINIMKDNEKTVNINSDKKRHWYYEFDNFNHTLKDWCDSLPYINVFDELLPNPLLY